MVKTLSQAAAMLGKKGGKRGGLARVPKGFATMTEERRREISKASIAKRWATAKKNAKPKKVAR